MTTTRETLHETAAEIAEIRVHALLQTFALPNVDEPMIEQLLKDALKTAYVGGFAAGWDAALDDAGEALQKVDRYRAPR